jgi:hypothetical protein
MMITLFAHLLPARDIDALVVARIADLRSRLEQCRETLAGTPTAGERFVCNYGEAMYRAGIEFLEENRHELLQAALLAERRAS